MDEAERYWFAFVLYSVRRLSENVGPTEKGLNLCQILRAAKLKYFLLSKALSFDWLLGNLYLLVMRDFVILPCSIVDFYKELHQFLIKVGSILSNLYGEDWEKRLEVVNDLEFSYNLADMLLLACFFFLSCFISIFHFFACGCALFLFVPTGQGIAHKLCALDPLEQVSMHYLLFLHCHASASCVILALITQLIFLYN